jgi:hypothetical protein
MLYILGQNSSQLNMDELKYCNSFNHFNILMSMQSNDFIILFTFLFFFILRCKSQVVVKHTEFPDDDLLTHNT